MLGSCEKIETAKGWFSDMWVAIYRDGDFRLYGYGNSKQEAVDEVKKKLEECHATG